MKSKTGVTKTNITFGLTKFLLLTLWVDTSTLLIFHQMKNSTPKFPRTMYRVVMSISGLNIGFSQPRYIDILSETETHYVIEDLHGQISTELKTTYSFDHGWCDSQKRMWETALQNLVSLRTEVELSFGELNPIVNSDGCKPMIEDKVNYEFVRYVNFYYNKFNFDFKFVYIKSHEKLNGTMSHIKSYFRELTQNNYGIKKIGDPTWAPLFNSDNDMSFYYGNVATVRGSKILTEMQIFHDNILANIEAIKIKVDNSYNEPTIS